ncbi:lasso peptide biosynthesis B2 protein [Sphingobium aromaticiconvertens]|uniref:lasso peptide biosynthesis B2 protein n=1 Tax=Sphingobium aromaticiconvertens TaxID=365341 RepID=UPI003019E690
MSQTVSFALVDDQPVFLDLANDRYLRLNQTQERAFLSLLSDRLHQQKHGQAIAQLVAGGLLLPVGSHEKPMACAALPLPSSSLLEGPLPGAGLGLIASALLQLRRTRGDLRRESLHAVIERLRHKKSRGFGLDADAARLLAIVAAFERTKLYLSSYRQCLPRSLAMAMHLAHAGISADLVIGVATKPFRAHCWVQHADIVLNDRLERVRNFTPILVA